MQVIAVDSYPNAPGMQVADRSHVISMLDGQALREIIEKEKPHIVVPEVEAIATDMLAEIEQQGICKIIPTARSVLYFACREEPRDRRLVA